MIEIEYTTDIEKDKPAQSSAKERKQDESKAKTDTQQTEVSEATEVVIKKFEDPLIKGQVLTAISPWFFRYWMFKFWNAKFMMNWGYGHSIRPIKKESTSDIYIQTGEALTEEDAEETIKRIKELFDKVE